MRISSAVNDLAVKGLTGEQMRCRFKAGLNSLVWFLWHMARWPDYAVRVVGPQNKRLSSL